MAEKMFSSVLEVTPSLGLQVCYGPVLLYLIRTNVFLDAVLVRITARRFLLSFGQPLEQAGGKHLFLKSAAV